MTKNSEDLRVRRTRALLQKALIELTIEKGFTDVTVRDITERAMVNRSTFYHHYQDKYALLSQYIDEVIALIQAQEDDPSQVNDPDQPSAGLVRILQHVQANADFYRVLLGKKGDPAFCAQSFRRFIEQQFRHMRPDQEVQADHSKPPIDLSVSYILHAGIGAILWWLENDQPCSPEQFAVWLNQFSMADMSVSLGLESPNLSL
ncbi:MAG: TetR/AcrR family transcriptional regulator [Chloroflexi bacterium]|nr:TetR/AcrR family transcriptional regulator [Chloroflexota bacterium]MCI0646536.1 TetR/AcrR family transcriptional regulator [Chloroflexota bacterium]MCI0726338.1 TetR/AcrR family transcriptional regulator [Chloroflexota bacterium]